MIEPLTENEAAALLQAVSDHRLRILYVIALTLGFRKCHYLRHTCAFDWNAPWQPLGVLFLWPSLLGLAFQVVLTLIQWHHRQRKRSPWYLGAVVLDSTLSYFGWRDLLVPFFERVYAGLGWPLPQGLAYGTVVLLAVAVAVIPEVFLLDG